MNAYHEDIDFHFPSLARLCPGSRSSIPHNQQACAEGRLYAPGEFIGCSSFICALYRSCTATGIGRQEISSRRAWYGQRMWIRGRFLSDWAVSRLGRDVMQFVRAFYTQFSFQKPLPGLVSASTS